MGAVRSVEFGLNTATGNQTVTVTSGALGKTPKAVVILLSRTSTPNSLVATGQISCGASDGTTERCCYALWESGQSAPTADMGRRADNNRLIRHTGTASETTNPGAATFVSFGTDSVTFNVTAAGDGAVRRCVAILFYGDEVQVDVRDLTGSSSIGGTVSASLSFQPDFAIAFTSGIAFTLNNNAAHAMMSAGFAGRLPSTTQAVSCAYAADRADAGLSVICGGIVRDDCVAVQLTSTLGIVSEGARLALSWDASGYTLTTQNAAAALDVMVLAVSFGGIKASANVVDFDTATVGSKFITSQGLTPVAIFAAGGLSQTNNALTSTDIGHISIGVATPFGQQCVAGGTRDGAGTAEGYSVTDDSHLLRVPDGTGLSNDDYLTLVSDFGPAHGYTVRTDDASPADRLVAILSIGGVHYGWLDARSGHRWRRCLARR